MSPSKGGSNHSVLMRGKGFLEVLKKQKAAQTQSDSDCLPETDLFLL